MSTITAQQTVLTHAAAAASLHAQGVQDALREYRLADNAWDRTVAWRRLHAELVLIATGADGAHNGSTQAERRAAAQAALDAWTE